MRHSKKRRFQKGPLPKTPYIPYTLPLYVPYADEKELLVTMGSDKEMDHAVNKLTFLTFAIIAALLAIGASIKSKPGDFLIVFSFWALPIIFISIGLYFNHKIKPVSQVHSQSSTVKKVLSLSQNTGGSLSGSLPSTNSRPIGAGWGRPASGLRTTP